MFFNTAIPAPSVKLFVPFRSIVYMWNSRYLSFPHRKFVKLSFVLLCFYQSWSMETLAASIRPLTVPQPWGSICTWMFPELVLQCLSLRFAPLVMAGLLFLSERFHWTSQCGHKHYLLSAPGLPPELKTKPLPTDSSFLSCWKVRAADAVCYWKEALCVPLCKWRCLSASLWCLYFAHREAGGPCQNPSPSVGPDPLGASLFSSLNWVHWSDFLFYSLLFLCLFAGKQMKLDRAENRSPESQRVPITSSGSQVCWPERLVLAKPRPVSPSCFYLSLILLHFSLCDCHSLSTWADSVLTPLIYLVADGWQ